LKRIIDVKMDPDMKIIDLMRIYDDIHGFVASSISRGAEILREMLFNSDLRFLAFTGNIVATGLRGILAQLLDSRVFNVVITTCGAVDHDIARSLDPDGYFKGSFEADDKELHEKKIHRLGNIFIKMESYGPLIERFTYELIDELIKIKKEWGVREILREAGRKLMNIETSILGAAYRNDIPIYVPGITDGAFGTALFTKGRLTGLKIDLFKDMSELSDLVFRSKSSGALIIGGGISKHHTIWWNQFKEGLNYAVYITTAQEYDGSLSGAKTREAISWGKINIKARHEVIYSEASIVLPLLAVFILYVLKDSARS